MEDIEGTGKSVIIKTRNTKPNVLMLFFNIFIIQSTNIKNSQYATRSAIRKSKRLHRVPLRRSATILDDVGGDLLDLKRHCGW